MNDELELGEHALEGLELVPCSKCGREFQAVELEACGSCTDVYCASCWTPRKDDQDDPCPGCEHHADCVEEARHRY